MRMRDQVWPFTFCLFSWLCSLPWRKLPGLRDHYGCLRSGSPSAVTPIPDPVAGCNSAAAALGGTRPVSRG